MTLAMTFQRYWIKRHVNRNAETVTSRLCLYFLSSQLLYHIIKQKHKYKCQYEVAYVHFHSLHPVWCLEDTKKVFCQDTLITQSTSLGHCFPLRAFCSNAFELQWFNS